MSKEEPGEADAAGEYPSYPDEDHSTRSYFGTIVDYAPPVHTILCTRCGAYEHGDTDENEEEAEARFVRERGRTCREWWLSKLAWGVMQT